MAGTKKHKNRVITSLMMESEQRDKVREIVARDENKYDSSNDFIKEAIETKIKKEY